MLVLIDDSISMTTTTYFSNLTLVLIDDVISMTMMTYFSNLMLVGRTARTGSD